MRKRIQLILLFIFILIGTGCNLQNESDSSRAIQRYASVLNVYLPTETCVFYEDTHSGFHGDGNTFLILELSDEENERMMETVLDSLKWKTCSLEEGQQYKYIMDELDERLPRWDEGYYIYYLKYPEIGSGNNIFVQYSDKEQKVYISEYDS